MTKEIKLPKYNLIIAYYKNESILPRQSLLQILPLSILRRCIMGKILLAVLGVAAVIIEQVFDDE